METDQKHILNETIKASVLAGKEIVKIYHTDFNVNYKSDHSPVTLADEKASDIITEHLKPFEIPVLSEEGDIAPFEIRKTWDKLWVVDPLDGTKEFVKKNGQFTVNVALVENHIPVLGVIYSPIFKDIYFAAKGLGAFKISGDVFEPFIDNISDASLDQLLNIAEKLPIHKNTEKYVVVASLSHMSSETYKHIEDLKLHHKTVEIINRGSSIKLCLVAEGTADEYPRFGPTMEWDTAAGQAILLESKADLLNFHTRETLLYNKQNLLNDWFIAKR